MEDYLSGKFLFNYCAIPQLKQQSQQILPQFRQQQKQDATASSKSPGSHREDGGRLVWRYTPKFKRQQAQVAREIPVNTRKMFFPVRYVALGQWPKEVEGSSSWQMFKI